MLVTIFNVSIMIHFGGDFNLTNPLTAKQLIPCVSKCATKAFRPAVLKLVKKDLSLHLLLDPNLLQDIIIIIIT